MMGGGNVSLRCTGGRWRFVTAGGSCSPADVGVDTNSPFDSARDTEATDASDASDVSDTLDTSEGG